MADDKVGEAVDTVARQMIANLIDFYGGDEWGNFPEIGEADWEAVAARATKIVSNLRPDPAIYDAAYEFLERRATDD